VPTDPRACTLARPDRRGRRARAADGRQLVRRCRPPAAHGGADAPADVGGVGQRVRRDRPGAALRRRRARDRRPARGQLHAARRDVLRTRPGRQLPAAHPQRPPGRRGRSARHGPRRQHRGVRRRPAAGPDGGGRGHAVRGRPDGSPDARAPRPRRARAAGAGAARPAAAGPVGRGVAAGATGAAARALRRPVRGRPARRPAADHRPDHRTRRRRRGPDPLHRRQPGPAGGRGVGALAGPVVRRRQPPRPARGARRGDGRGGPRPAGRRAGGRRGVHQPRPRDAGQRAPARSARRSRAAPHRRGDHRARARAGLRGAQGGAAAVPRPGSAPRGRRRRRGLRQPAARAGRRPRPDQGRHGADPRRGQRSGAADPAGRPRRLRRGDRLPHRRGGGRDRGGAADRGPLRHRPGAGVRAGPTEHDPGVERLRGRV
ncbi:MAG: diguanylate cyclase/phosphodiesterase (GGDEF & EAL domains) with PAS/PAC sensor(s), partial [uncultured Frankineae bacterium]